MRKQIVVAVLALGACGCANTKDLAKTLRYADNTPVCVEKIQFAELSKMKRGTTCTTNIFYVVPLWGDGSIITAADKGQIDSVQLIGETGRWYFPFSTNCTVVFGDKEPAVSAPVSKQ